MDPAVARRADGDTLPAPGFTRLRTLSRDRTSVVHLAREENRGRLVVVRVFRVPIADARVLERFRREARISASLEHPGLARVHAAGQTRDGRPFLVMEHLPGGSLADAVRQRGHLSVTNVIDIGVVMADALAAAHSRGVLHRDLRPRDVLFDLEDRPKLSGFGVWRLTADNRPDDPALDVLGLGGTLLWAWLGGRSGDTPSAAARAPHDEERTATSVVLSRLLERCMRRDPLERPSLDEVRRSLRALQARKHASPAAATASSTRVIHAPTTRVNALPPAIVRPSHPEARWRTLGLTVAGAALLATSIVGAWSWIDGDDGRPTPSDPVADTRGDLEATPSTSPEASPRTDPAPPASAPTDSQPAVSAPPQPAVSALPQPAVSAPPQPQASAVMPVPADDAAAFVVAYYDTVNAEDYERGWTRLSPEFRERRASTFEGYARYWSEYDVEVGSVDVVRTADTGESVVRVGLRYISATRSVDEVDDLTVRRDGSDFVIVDQRVIG